MRHRTLCFRSSSQHLPDTLFGRLFLGRSLPRLLSAAAPGSLKPTPESRLREACSHLRYSLQAFACFMTHPRTAASSSREPGLSEFCPSISLLSVLPATNHL